MGITGLIPFLEKASRRANVDEFNGCTVAIDSYCWLHKGAFACAEKLVRGEDTDIYIKYCLKYVSMLLSKNIKPILVFDGQHLPAKALTEIKRRESRNISKTRAAELLSLGQIDEARSYMRRSVDITHAMALNLIKECRKRNVDCIVAPYEADSQLAYLNIKGIAHLVITEDSDLILFGCTKVLFKMDLDGTGTLVETTKLPLVMRCPIEHYNFDKFRQMCIMSGCDYLASLPGIGLAKARQFITATQDPNIANALRKLPSYFNKSSLTVTDEYRENFLKAEATFKHQYVYDPIERKMVRLTEPENEDIETALCVNAGKLLEPKVAFQLALGNLDPFSLKKVDDWNPDDRNNETNTRSKTDSWKDKPASHPSIWTKEFETYLKDPCPWQKKVKKQAPIIAIPQTKPRKKIVNMVSKYVAETQDQDEGLSIETLSSMYCEPASKKTKLDDSTNTQDDHNTGAIDLEIEHEVTSQNEKSPILENKERSFRKCMKNFKEPFLKRLSRFPRTVLDNNIVESKFFNTNIVKEIIEESPVKYSRNPFKINSDNISDIIKNVDLSILEENSVEFIPNETKSIEIDSQITEIPDSQLSSSQKENSPQNSPMKQKSPVLEVSFKKNLFSRNTSLEYCGQDDASSEQSVIENTYPFEQLVTPVDSQLSYGDSPPKLSQFDRLSKLSLPNSQPSRLNNFRKNTCKVPGLKRTTSLPNNQPTLLSKFGFQKKPVLKK